MKRVLISFLAILFCVAIHAQELDAAVVKSLVESKNYVFTARTVSPQRGRVRQLTTTDYDLVVRPDTVSAYLPFFGRAFTAPIDPSEGGIKFTSTQFAYESRLGKKNRWQVNIKPKDASDVRDVYLEIYENGRAFVRVNSNNRESISYDGFIKEGKPFDKKAF